MHFMTKIYDVALINMLPVQSWAGSPSNNQDTQGQWMYSVGKCRSSGSQRRMKWPSGSTWTEALAAETQSQRSLSPFWVSGSVSILRKTTLSLRLKDPTLGFRFGANGFFEMCLLASINGMHDEVPGTNTRVTASAHKMCKVRVSVEAQNVKPCLTSFLEMPRNENDFSFKLNGGMTICQTF